MVGIVSQSPGPILLQGGAAALGMIYIACLVVGGGLLLVSTLFASSNGSDVDADVDVSPPDAMDANTGDFGHDVGHGMEHGAAVPHVHRAGVTLASWFSIQFAVYFLAVFGLVGTTLSYGSSLRELPVLLTAVLAGALVGQGVHQVLRVLKKSGRSSEVSSADFTGKPARVSVAIEPRRMGEVVVSLASGERYVSASARHGDDRFGVGDRVVVTAFRNGIAEVVSQKEHEFLTGS